MTNKKYEIQKIINARTGFMRDTKETPIARYIDKVFTNFLSTQQSLLVTLKDSPPEGICRPSRYNGFPVVYKLSEDMCNE